MNSRVATTATALSLIVSLISATSEEIPFSSCTADEPTPDTVTMDCEGMSHGTCILKKGQTHTLTADFSPDISSTRVNTYVAWKSWVEMPLPRENENTCHNFIECPLREGTETTFTYPLNIQNFWMRRRYPMVWKLTDMDTDETVLCFVIRIQIV
ncbi:hypothetical protein SK128_001851 [Halocaridina rubra]|uniref:MD-2-related lipid-recognition domain-containing protein n=1 Tax=Halocaridina rubra TaxID=373956 RepID=A0AAN8WHB5_HALRR